MAGYGQGAYGSGLYGAARTTASYVARDTFPPRVQIAVGGMSIGDDVSVSRVVPSTGEEGSVRGSVPGLVATTDGMTFTDAEFPLGVDLQYEVFVAGLFFELDVTAAEVDSGGKVILSDAINGNAAEVVVTAWPDKSRQRTGSVFNVAGGNVVVSGKRGQFSSTLEVFTETETARQNLDDLLNNATQGILQLRQPGGYADVDCYVVVTSDICSRFSQDGSDERRRWSLDVAEVSGWASALVDLDFTLADLANAYDGLTLADLAGDYDTLLDLAAGDFS